MSKAEILKCRQDVCSEWLITEPTLIQHITEKMHNELGKALADRICDGQMYAVVMQKARIKTDDVSFHKDYSVFRSEIKLQPIVRCKECKKSHIDGKTTHYLWCVEWGRSTDVFGYCERGEREGE